jgi:creatinine amidohydrolase
MTIRRWADLSTTDFAALDRARAIAVLPVGAVEQHGPHLPLSTDTDLAEGVLARLAARVDPALTILILPTQALGRSIEHEGFDGTLSLSAETLLALWKDIGRSVAASGIRKLVFFNGHGGNVSAMDIVARDLRADHGMLTAHTSWFALSGQEEALSSDELRHGIHGGAAETAAMLALDPERVRMDAAANFPSRGRDWAERFETVGVGGTPVKLGWLMRDLSAAGAVGDASGATAELGDRLLDTAAARFAAFLSEFDAMSPDLR